MSDDKKTEAQIQWWADEDTHCQLEVLSVTGPAAGEEYRKVATTADLAAAGYIKAELLEAAKTHALRLLCGAEDAERQLTEATAKLEAAEGLLEAERQGRREAFRAWNDAQNQRDHALSNLKTKLEAAEECVRELEEERGATHEWVPRLTVRVQELERKLTRLAAVYERVEHESYQQTGRYKTALCDVHHWLNDAFAEPAPEAAKPAGGEGTHMVDEGSYNKGVYDATHGQLPAKSPCATRDCLFCAKHWPEAAKPAEPEQAAAMEPWVPELLNTVRFKGTPVGSWWYTVRGVDINDHTALITCNDDQQCMPAWHSWDQLEPAPDYLRPQPPRADGPDVLTVIAAARHELEDRSVDMPTATMRALRVLLDGAERAQKGAK